MAFNNSAKEKPTKRHIIDDISFSKDFIVCICAWKGPIDDFRDHRKEAMAKEDTESAA